MNDLQIQFPDNFPLHGIERDAFETKLRDALHYVFDGRRVRQLAEQVDARRPFEPPDALPLRRIGDEHAFEQCLTLDRCRFDDMSAALRRMILRSVSGRLGVEVAEPGLAGAVSGDDVAATNRHPSPLPARRHRPGRSISLAAGLCAGVAGVVAAWHMTHPAPSVSMPLSATVLSTTPAQALRDLASSVPTDQRPYRITVQVVSQSAGARD
ncbi:hypothetical protein [Paraburkholderia tropica]|uniref:hypothetical protein n=1 Tax=Paraburkholderia tropica TaxID=92647 RepID=UPI002AB7E9F0|nr:hypothetical protein [Paraburkholderia tropica]